MSVELSVRYVFREVRLYPTEKFCNVFAEVPADQLELVQVGRFALLLGELRTIDQELVIEDEVESEDGQLSLGEASYPVEVKEELPGEVREYRTELINKLIEDQDHPDLFKTKYDQSTIRAADEAMSVFVSDGISDDRVQALEYYRERVGLVEGSQTQKSSRIIEPGDLDGLGDPMEATRGALD